MCKFKIKSKSKNYYVFFSNNLISSLKLNLHKNDFIIADKKILQYLNNLRFISTNNIISITANEKTKDYRIIGNIISKLINGKFSKKNKLIVIGGGITQDIGSFISHIIFRGVDWIYIPTTLLSQADSCIGSKISINFNNYKNLLGNYNPPNKIFINTNFLNSLNKKDIYSGIGEMLHYFLISSKKDYSFFKKNIKSFIKSKKSLLETTIKKCLKIKQKFIEKDEFDKGIRIYLNYGHTFGHALESYTKYKIPHGIAVCHGINISNYISFKLNLLSKTDYDDIYKTVKIITKNYPLNKINVKKFCQIILKDKKTINGVPRFIFLKKPGLPILKSIKLNKTFENYLSSYFINQ